MRRGIGLFFVLSLAAGFVVACSSASSSNNAGGGGGGSGGMGAGGSGGINVGGDAGGGNGGTGALTGCGKIEGGEVVPLDMYLMLDKSGSMKDGGKWGAVTGAITQFVGLPNLDKLGMGLGLFPIPAAPGTIPTGTCTSDQDCGFYGPCMPVFNQCNGALAGMNDSCVATDYQKPIVGIADLPGVGTQIKAEIGKTAPDGNSTPAGPALEGAIDIATLWAQGHTDRITVVVLATDGEPNNCNPNDPAKVAGEGLAQTPSIKTFVIGVGYELTSLNAIAAAGGTNQAILVSAGNAGAEFLDALNKIRGGMVCQYVLPQDGKSDPNKVNVLFTPTGGPGQTIGGVAGAGECQGEKAWYYDDKKTQILLCPAACDMVKNVPGKIEIVLGCPTEPPK